MAGSIVQSKVGEGAGGATTVATGSFGSNVTVNNYLLIVTNSDTADTVTISKNSGTATIGTVTEQGSVTEAATFEELTVFTCAITGSGSLDLLATFGSSQANRQIYAFEIGGVNAVQGHNEQTDTGSNPTPTLTFSVTTQPAFGVAICIDVQGGTPTAGSGWTSYGVLGSTVHFARVQTKAITATGSTTANFGNAGFDRNNATMVVFTDGSAGPTINTNPANATVYQGQTANFTVSATTSGGTLHYQWKDDGSNVGTDSSSYTTGATVLSDNGAQITCDVTDDNGTVTSSAATLTVIATGITSWIRA